MARSVLALCEDWNRLCVQNLAGVVTWLQTRGKSGRFEVEAFGARGTIFLQDGELVEARWKELEGREVVRFFAEELPDSGFRFAEVAGPPDDRALEVPHAPAALEVPHAPAALEPGAPPHPAAPPFREIYTAVVRIDLGSDGRLTRAGVRSVPAGDGSVVIARADEPEDRRATVMTPTAANGNGGPPAAKGVAGAVQGFPEAANGVTGQIPHAPPAPRLVPSSAGPRRPTALVRAISRAEREALLTGTDSRR